MIWVQMERSVSKQTMWITSLTLLTAVLTCFYLVRRKRHDVQQLAQPLHRGELRIAGAVLDRLAVRLLEDQPGVKSARVQFWLRGQELMGRIRVRPLADGDPGELIPSLERMLYRKLAELVGLHPRRLHIELVPAGDMLARGRER